MRLFHRTVVELEKIENDKEMDPALKTELTALLKVLLANPERKHDRTQDGGEVGSGAARSEETELLIEPERGLQHLAAVHKRSRRRAAGRPDSPRVRPFPRSDRRKDELLERDEEETK